MYRITDTPQWPVGCRLLEHIAAAALPRHRIRSQLLTNSPKHPQSNVFTKLPLTFFSAGSCTVSTAGGLTSIHRNISRSRHQLPAATSHASTVLIRFLVFLSSSCSMGITRPILTYNTWSLHLESTPGNPPAASAVGCNTPWLLQLLPTTMSVKVSHRLTQAFGRSSASPWSLSINLATQLTNHISPPYQKVGTPPHASHQRYLLVLLGGSQYVAYRVMLAQNLRVLVLRHCPLPPVPCWL
jgi:hypothetical protein